MSNPTHKKKKLALSFGLFVSMSTIIAQNKKTSQENSYARSVTNLAVRTILKESLPQEPPRPTKKIGAEAQGFQEASSLQEIQLPGGTDTDGAVAEAVPVFDADAALAEEADARDATGERPRRRDRPLRAGRPTRAVAPLPGLAEYQDVLGDFRDRRGHFVFRRKHLDLLLWCARRRTRNDFA